MKDASTNSNAKRLAGEAAAELVKSGMVVGLGTGSTVAWTIKRLGERVREEGLVFLGVPTSFQAEHLAIASGIKLTSLNQHPFLDLAIDGADQVDEDLFAIKGGGAAHTREKVVSCSAKRFVIVADESKVCAKAVSSGSSGGAGICDQARRAEAAKPWRIPSASTGNEEGRACDH